MKKSLSIWTIIAASSLALAAPALSDTPGNFGGNGNAWSSSGDDHYTHKNDVPRMDWKTGRKAIPGNAGKALDDNPGKGGDNSVVRSWGDDNLVDPHRTLED